MTVLSQSLPEAKRVGNAGPFCVPGRDRRERVARGTGHNPAVARAFTTAAALLLLAALAGSAGAGAGPAISDQAWQLTTLTGVSRGVSTVTVQFSSDGSISGFSGCNQYGGTYSTSGSGIAVSKSLAVTRMACSAPRTRLERVYLAALTSARRYSIANSKLTLRSRRGLTLATFAVESQSLAGTRWTVISYNDGKQAVVSVVSGAKLTAAFDAKGRVSGFAGCNTYGAAVVAKPPTISFGPVEATRKACAGPRDVMAQESRYLAALGTATTYRIEGPSLELRTKTGAIAADLARA